MFLQTHFKRGQRWISELEPELGLGIIIECSNRMVKVQFPGADKPIAYAAGNAPLKRVCLSVGMSVQDRAGKAHEIVSVAQENDLYTYACKDTTLSETEIAESAAAMGPLQRLLKGIADDVADFSLRRSLQQFCDHLLHAPGRGLMGGKIELLPHQLYIANEITSRRLPRALLSDETGLGKTIEACLVVHRLLTTDRIKRVLIIVPGALVHQWFVELLRRFNLTFRIFEKQQLDDIDGKDNPFDSAQLWLCNVHLIAKNTRIGHFAAQATWDMVIVDEAHHIRAATPAFHALESLASHSPGLLLLTATPEQLGRRSHFERLKLLDPQRYGDYEAYEAESLRYRELAGLVTAVLKEESTDGGATRSELRIDVPANLLDANDHNPGAMLHLKLSELIDRYGPGRIVFRTTRRAVLGFPERVVEIIPLSGAEETIFHVNLEYQSRHATVARNDPRVAWIKEFIEQQRARKVLIICHNREKAISLQEAIAAHLNCDLALFHEDMTILQRDRNAAWFADPQGANVLISSEIGSEGRNFQFCQHLILFDLPREPEVLEQRIGRLDRIGQQDTIYLHIPYVTNTVQELLVRWYHEGLNALKKNIAAAGRVHDAQRPEMDRLMQLAANNFGAHHKEIESLLADTRRLAEKFHRRILQGRDLLLELSSFNAEVAHHLTDEIAGMQRDPVLPMIMEKIFAHFGVALEDAGEHKSALLTQYVTDPGFPLPRGERPIITDDRATALEREDADFITCDHPMLTGGLHMILSSDKGTSSFGLLEDPQNKLFLLEAVYIIDCIAPPRYQAYKYLAAQSIRIVVDHQKRNVTQDYPSVKFSSSLKNAPISRLLSNNNLVKKVLPAMAEQSRAYAAEQAEPLMRAAIAQMNSTLQSEIDRLTWLHKVNPAVPGEEIELCMQERDELHRYLSTSGLRLDSLRVIWHGPAPKK
ncbi:MAG: RNA polymerase-associated protein RapA [Chitinivibrionales bacterium]|nr:RNA polymerase-associated protein RapA [Chitinivibrionales bacterium]